jgi:hypothetical protein
LTKKNLEISQFQVVKEHRNTSSLLCAGAIWPGEKGRKETVNLIPANALDSNLTIFYKVKVVPTLTFSNSAYS